MSDDLDFALIKNLEQRGTRLEGRCQACAAVGARAKLRGAALQPSGIFCRIMFLLTKQRRAS